MKGSSDARTGRTISNVRPIMNESFEQRSNQARHFQCAPCYEWKVRATLGSGAPS